MSYRGASVPWSLDCCCLCSQIYPTSLLQAALPRSLVTGLCRGLAGVWSFEGREKSGHVSSLCPGQRRAFSGPCFRVLNDTITPWAPQPWREVCILLLLMFEPLHHPCLAFQPSHPHCGPPAVRDTLQWFRLSERALAIAVILLSPVEGSAL